MGAEEIHANLSVIVGMEILRREMRAVYMKGKWKSEEMGTENGREENHLPDSFIIIRLQRIGPSPNEL